MSDIVIQFREKLARAEVARQEDFSGNLRFDKKTQQVVGKFLRCSLSSVYQPIVDVQSRKVIGHEAFIRSHHVNQGGLTPWNLFSQYGDDAHIVYLDRLCRTLHTLNYFSNIKEDRNLHLNIHGHLLLAVIQNHGKAFRRVLDALLIPSDKIVLELPLIKQEDFSLLHHAIKSYRAYGFKIGVNVNTSSDANTIVHLVNPDVIKINVNHLKANEDWHKLSKLTRNHKISIIATHVENVSKLNLVRELNIECAQGFLFGAPTLQAENLPI